MSEALQSLRKIQLTRSLIVAQLSKPNIADLLSGLYVRVLLELEGGGEEYKIARVVGVERGSEYNGFTYDAMVSTDKYLVLELSPPAKSDNHYQLNSVSNKEFQTNEFSTWQRDVTAGRIPRPTDIEYTTLLEKMRRLNTGGSAGVASAVPIPRNSNNATFRSVGGAQQAPSVPAHGAAAAAAASASGPADGRDDESEESDYDHNDDEMVRLVEEEMRDKHFVVPTDLNSQTTQQLRVLEKDILEYLDRLRECLDTHTTKCIACMVQEPAVIIMPCKHKVLCRGCCTKVLICPMCRVKIREVFEPVEM